MKSDYLLLCDCFSLGESYEHSEKKEANDREKAKQRSWVEYPNQGGDTHYICVKSRANQAAGVGRL
jgi:hypothetical protein